MRPASLIVAAFDTLRATTAEVLGEFVASPEYTAVSEWLPAPKRGCGERRRAVAHGNCAENRRAIQELHRAGGAGTVRLRQLNVTAWPAVAGLGDAAKVADVAALLTVSVKTADVLPRYPAPSPLYTAVMA